VKAVARNAIAAGAGAGTAGGREGGGGVTHAVIRVAAAATANRRRYDAMEWIVLEAGVALFLAVFIVWFTTGGKRKRPPVTEQTAPESKGSPEQKL
jgi:hypothetical protein